MLDRSAFARAAKRWLALVAVGTTLLASCAQAPTYTPPITEHRLEGQGWKLIDQGPWGAPYSVAFLDVPGDVKALPAEDELRASVADVDFSRQAVLVLGTAVSSSCPWIRFDGLGISGQLVHGRFTHVFDLIELPEGVACSGDAAPYTFVVAVSRDVLPEPPFTLRLEARIQCQGCGGTEEMEIVAVAAEFI